MNTHNTGRLWVGAQFLLLGTWFCALIVGGRGPAPMAVLVAGIAIVACGGALAMMGVAAMRFRVTPFPEPRASATLLTRGIYGRVRHPMYGGIILSTFGLSLALWSFAALAVVSSLAFFFLLKSRYEEERLRTRFADYTAYMERTRRFIPYLW